MNNLEKAIRKRNGLIIAIDFDGTIVDHRFPKIGKLKPGARRVIRKLKEEGHNIIIWTCRNYRDKNYSATISAVQEFLEDCDIPFDTINENASSLEFWLESRKIYADVYIDDHNLGGFPGWIKTYQMIQCFMKSMRWYEVPEYKEI